jgi:hypothetical protein
MKMTLNLRTIFDEYIYKYMFIIVGLLYWVYGFTGSLGNILTYMIVLALIPSLGNLVLRVRRVDFRMVLGVLTLALGLLTVISCDSRSSTLLTLFRVVEKMLLLGFCAPEKSKIKIEHEITSIYRVIAVIGSIILLVSLGTYFAGISIPYYIYAAAVTEESTTLFVGRYGGRLALCGVLANPNMASNFCVIFLGVALSLLKYQREKYLYIFLWV